MNGKLRSSERGHQRRWPALPSSARSHRSVLDAGHFGPERQNRASVGRTVHPGMKRSRRNEQGVQALAATGWSAASFRISTADGWLEVDGIIRPPFSIRPAGGGRGGGGLPRPPFGIDQRATDETGNGSWVVTHLPSGLAVVSRVRALAVALALADRIAALTDWEAQNISATPELREQVREALNRAYGDFFADRLPVLPEDASPAA